MKKLSELKKGDCVAVYQWQERGPRTVRKLQVVRVNKKTVSLEDGTRMEFATGREPGDPGYSRLRRAEAWDENVHPHEDAAYAALGIIRALNGHGVGSCANYKRLAEALPLLRQVEGLVVAPQEGSTP